MTRLVPSRYRLSKHFLLSDFMGSSSIYAAGIPNVFDKKSGHDDRLAHGLALAEQILEPLLETYGPVSVSYGFISPGASRATVTYQDPNKPSYHRWDIGAAADVCVHKWLEEQHKSSHFNSPIMLAHYLDNSLGLPYSRMITYSESPFICLAANFDEVTAGEPRRAMYENRYEGVKGARPAYTKLVTEAARKRHFDALLADGLPHGWVGAGHPTYHGTRMRQLHHVRVSRYTMLTDWLYDDQNVTEGYRNCPRLTDPDTLAAFRRVGYVYDQLIDTLGVLRLSITQGYLDPRHEAEGYRCWTDNGPKQFTFVPPFSDWSGEEVCGIPYYELEAAIPGVRFDPDAHGICVLIDE